MCRYTWKEYKSHFACFDCRRSLKRGVRPPRNWGGGDNLWSNSQQPRCPHCGKDMVELGRDFKPPKADDIKQWAKVKVIYDAGLPKYQKAVKLYEQKIASGRYPGDPPRVFPPWGGGCGCNGPGYTPKTLSEMKRKQTVKLSRRNEQKHIKGSIYDTTLHGTR